MCRVTMGHLRVTVSRPRVTIGHLRVTVGHPRVTIGHLRVTLGYFWLRKQPEEIAMYVSPLVS